MWIPGSKADKGAYRELEDSLNLGKFALHLKVFAEYQETRHNSKELLKIYLDLLQLEVNGASNY